MNKQKIAQDKFIRYMIRKVSALYVDTLKDFSHKEKIEILNRPKIKMEQNVIAGKDYERNKNDELFLKHIDKFIKDFFYTSKREKAFNHHLGKIEQLFYTSIWEKNEKIKKIHGKYKLSDAVRFVLLKENPSLSDDEKQKYYNKVRRFMSKHKIKSLSSWKFFLGNIGYSPKV